MSGGVFGGGVIFVVAALLWAAVLVPAWLRRREFRAAERNALRLQRTLRVLAETSEVPQELRLEATAREALAHEKLLRTAQRKQEAEREAKLAAERAEQVRAEIRAQQVQRQQAAMQRAAKLRRPIVRRTRALAALISTIGIVGMLVGAGFAIAGSGTALLIGAALLGAVGTGTLLLLAPGRTRMQPIAAEEVDAEIEESREPAGGAHEEPAAVDEAAAAHAAAQQAAADRIARARALARARAGQTVPAKENLTDSILLREASEQVAEARRAASAPGGAEVSEGQPAIPAEGEVTGDRAETGAAAARVQERISASEAAILGSVRRRSASYERAERLRSMGVVGDTSAGMPDLDEVFRRRSAG